VTKRTSVNRDGDEAYQSPFSAGPILDRLRRHAQVETDTDFAAKYGLSRNTVAKWRARNTVPLELIAKVALEDNLSLDWIMLGRGPMRAETSAVRAPDAPFDESLLTLSVETLRRELDGANLELPSDKFARAVVLVYSLLADVPEREKSAGTHVKRMLRLVV